MPMNEDKILTAIVRLTNKVETLSKRVDAHEKKLTWITSAALFVIGVVGGPNAVNLITSGTT